MSTTSLDRSAVLDRVRAELAVAAPDVAPDAPPAADLRYDLGIDSLALVELVARLEYEYSIAVPDEDWQSLTTLDAITDYLLERTACAKP
jgi:acyl carrier protein